ncbi:MAG: AbrB/MazE/SpoVT family DNA-binding domain-containing protein [Methanomassiliicoccales archaeon]
MFVNIVYMDGNPKILGITKVSSKGRISLLKDVADKLDIVEGDKLVFILNGNGDVLIKKA